MALTDEEVVRIKRYLGYDLITADAWRGDAAAGLDRNVSRLDDTSVTLVREVLAELAAVDAGITDARTRTSATQLGDLKIDALRELKTLRGERAAFAGELAQLLGVTPPGGAGGPGRIVV